MPEHVAAAAAKTAKAAVAATTTAAARETPAEVAEAAASPVVGVMAKLGNLVNDHREILPYVAGGAAAVALLVCTKMRRSTADDVTMSAKVTLTPVKAHPEEGNVEVVEVVDRKGRKLVVASNHSEIPKGVKVDAINGILVTTAREVEAAVQSVSPHESTTLLLGSLHVSLQPVEEDFDEEKRASPVLEKSEVVRSVVARLEQQPKEQVEVTVSPPPEADLKTPAPPPISLSPQYNNEISSKAANEKAEVQVTENNDATLPDNNRSIDNVNGSDSGKGKAETLDNVPPAKGDVPHPPAEKGDDSPGKVDADAAPKATKKPAQPAHHHDAKVVKKVVKKVVRKPAAKPARRASKEF